MLKTVKKYIGNINNYRHAKRMNIRLTSAADCVNLSMCLNGLRGVCYYNNSDLIAVVGWDELGELTAYGDGFYAAVVYSLCVKYSINYYW
jgi:hypothetical protein